MKEEMNNMSKEMVSWCICSVFWKIFRATS